MTASYSSLAVLRGLWERPGSGGQVSKKEVPVSQIPEESRPKKDLPSWVIPVAGGFLQILIRIFLDRWL